MNSHPRIRKTIKWGGAVVSMLLVVAWIATIRWCIGYAWPSHIAISASHGMFWFTYKEHMDYPGPLWNRRFEKVRWSLAFDRQDDDYYAGFPLWLLSGAGLAATFAAWRLDAIACRRSRKPNLCDRCGYDRAGLAGLAVCPECGAGP